MSVLIILHDSCTEGGGISPKQCSLAGEYCSPDEHKVHNGTAGTAGYKEKAEELLRTKQWQHRGLWSGSESRFALIVFAYSKPGLLDYIVIFAQTALKPKSASHLNEINGERSVCLVSLSAYTTWRLKSHTHIFM